MIRNQHTRTIFATVPEPVVQARALQAALGSKEDRLWPSDRWPPMRLDRPMAVGAKGGHGAIRYTVVDYTHGETDGNRPTTRVTFEFAPAIGLVGTHEFILDSPADGVIVLTHIVSARANGTMRIQWPLIVEPIHDALIEDAFDNAEALLTNTEIARQTLGLKAKLALRLLAALRKPKSSATKKQFAVGTVTAAALASIGAIHVAWGHGSNWPRSSRADLARLVVGSEVFPSMFACDAVATLLFGAAVVVRQQVTRRPNYPGPLHFLAHALSQRSCSCGASVDYSHRDYCG